MNDKLFVTIVSGIFALILGIIGWSVNHYLSIVLKKRTETSHFLERQIGELYGPLVGLIEHSQTIYFILRKKIQQYGDQPLEMSRLSKEDYRVWNFFQEKFFIPINSEIRALIRTKTHLLENGRLPESFSVFFIHEAHYSTLHPMWQEENIDSLHVQGPPWPEGFHKDVKESLERLTKNHQDLIKTTHSN